MNKKVLVIGAGGRVGYPFAKYCAWKGFETYGYDRNPQSFEIAKTYQEENVPNVKFHEVTETETYRLLLNTCGIAVIMIGTPIDGEGNPRCDGLFSIRDEIVESLKHRNPKDPLLIVLRSTVSPGITSQFREHIQNALSAYHPEIFVAFCPERIAQGHTFTELASIPQIIGCLEMDEFLTAAAFFCALGCECIRMKDVEAELGKLMTNMYRYVNFALANEFAMIADHHGADYEYIRKSINKDYPRMDLAKAGPNSAGPCLKTGTMIATPKGYVAIEDLSIGSNVLDGMGITIVTDKKERVVNKSVTIKMRGMYLSSSLDHIHLISKNSEGPCLETFAKDIEKNDWVFIPDNFPSGIKECEIGPRQVSDRLVWHEKIVLDEMWARLIGLYLAEGNMGMYGNGIGKKRIATVVWNFGEHEEALATEVQNILISKGISSFKYLMISKKSTYGESRCWRIRCRSLWLFSFFEKLGIKGKANTKECPFFDVALIPHVLGGWLEGDGNQSNGTISGWSNSTKLTTMMWRMSLKIGICGNMSSGMKKVSFSMRKDVEFLCKYVKRFSVPDHYMKLYDYASPDMRKIDTGWMVRITEVVQTNEYINVVGIETKSGRYVAENIETHNCLFKDGQFLVSHIPYNELIKSAFSINEGMPEWIVSKIEAYQNDRLVPFRQVGIMGMSFKADNDDTRYSLSFKLKKILERKGYRVVCSDPYIKEYAENDLYGCDVVVVMTPHSHFDKLSYRASIASGTLVIDLWRHFEASKHNGLNGVFIKHGVV